MSNASMNNTSISDTSKMTTATQDKPMYINKQHSMDTSFSGIIKDFLTFPFRLNFLLSSLSVIVIAMIWPMVAQGIYPFSIDPISLHAYGFLNIVGGAAFAGFILTAIPEWTHDARPLIPYSSSLFILWLVGTFSSVLMPPIAGIAFTLFWLWLSLIVMLFALKARDSKIISVIFLLSSVTILSACYTYQPSIFWLKQIAHVFIAGVALIMFRIGKAIGQRAVDDSRLADCRFMPNPFYKNLSVWFIYAYVASQIFLDNSIASAWISVAGGLAMLGRLRDWHYPLMFKRYYIRWYYLTLLSIGVGYVWLGLSTILDLNQTTAAFHLIMLGGFLMMLMQVFSIAGVAHSSLSSNYPLVSRLALAGIFGAALSRSLGSLSTEYYIVFVFYLPALLLVMAFTIYIPMFYRIFTTNPGAPVTPRKKD